MHQASTDEVAIIGAGPAGLFAAEVLAQAGRRVVVFDAMASPGRKFLMAGRGGLNLTHSEPLETFLTRYGTTAFAPLIAAVRSFPPEALVAWANGLGQQTFVGSSGRVFPKSLKASPLLRAWLARLSALGVELRLRHRWTGWTEGGALCFAGEHGAVVTFDPAATLLALGGASWPRLGSDGAWTAILEKRGVELARFEPANSGALVNWSEHMRSRFAGAPLKRIAVSADGATNRGEIVITRAGLEGGAIYALTPLIRDAVSKRSTAVVVIDLRPDVTMDELARRLARPRGKQSAANFLRKAASLSPAGIALLREAAGGPLPVEPAALAALIKRAAVPIHGVAGLERAISSAGGVSFNAIDDVFMLRPLPGVFVAGEMLDWEAPTGGYLLQASFATGAAAARGLMAWLDRPSPQVC
jgi:hypothetical protein